jgi:hypothetical protein
VRYVIAAAVVAATLASEPLAAQWIYYPTPGVPRTADGSPDLGAPAPRGAGGKPDFSGIWTAAGEALPQCEGQADCIEQMPLPLVAVNIGHTLPGGLPYQPWAADLVREHAAASGADDPHARCLPPNFPRAFSFPQFKKIVQLPDLIVILHEFNASYRQIHLDGRPLPEDPSPTWNGYSTARWDGDALVVESIGFRDDLWLDLQGSPLTEAARVVERVTRPSFGTLRIELTVDDPKAYTRPWTVTLEQTLVLDTELMDQICLENEKSVRLMGGE